MPFNASGFFQRLFNWRNDRDAGIKILAERMDQEMDGIVAGINDIVSANVDWKGPMTGVFGTANAPAYSFQEDPNTGVYRVSADVLGFSVGGTKKTEVTATGLNVSGSVTATGLNVSGSATATGLNVSGTTTLNWANVNDGAGSGADADLLDGQHGSFYQNAENLNAGRIPVERINGLAPEFRNLIKVLDSGGDGSDFWLHSNNDGFFVLADRDNDGASDGPHPLFLSNSTNSAQIYGQTVWTAGTDGPDSGLNADLLDGQQGSYYRNAGNLNAGTVPAARLSGAYNISISGSAAQLNGLLASSYLRSNADDKMEGRLDVGADQNQQMRIGHDTGGPKNSLIGLYDGEDTLVGYLQALNDKMRLYREGGGDLQIHGTNDLRMNGNIVFHGGVAAYGVGSIVLGANVSGGTISNNQTVAGSKLRQARISTSGAVGLSGGGLSGTWKALGYTPDDNASLFVRIT